MLLPRALDHPLLQHRLHQDGRTLVIRQRVTEEPRSRNERRAIDTSLMQSHVSSVIQCFFFLLGRGQKALVAAV